MNSFSQVVADSCRQLIKHISVLTDVMAQGDPSESQLEAAKTGVRNEVDQFLHFLQNECNTPFADLKLNIIQTTKNLQCEMLDVDERFIEALNKQEFLAELRGSFGGYIREIGLAAKTASSLEDNEKRVVELLVRSRASLHQCLAAVKVKDNETFSYELRCVVACLGKLSQIDVQLDDRIRQLLRLIFANAKDFFNNPDNVFAGHPLAQDLAGLGAFIHQLLTERCHDSHFGGEYYEEEQVEGWTDNADTGGQYYNSPNSYDGIQESGSTYEDYASPQPASPATSPVLTHNHPPLTIPNNSHTQARASSPRASKPISAKRPPAPPPKPSAAKPRPDRPSSVLPHSPSSASLNAPSTTTLVAGSTTITTAFDKGGKITEEDFVQAILMTCPRDYATFTPDELAQFELGVRQRLKTYQSSLILTMISESALLGQETQTTRSRLIQPINKPRGKLGVVVIDLKAAKGGYKDIHSLTSDFISEVIGFLNKYNDLGVNWDPKRVVKKEDESAIKQCPFIVTLTNHAIKLHALIQTAVRLADSYDSNLPEALITVVNRIRAVLAKEMTGVTLPLDTKLYERGQYLRFMKQSCLGFIFRKIESMLDTCSHFCTLLSRFGHVYDETATVYLLFHAELFSNEIRAIIDHVKTFETLYLETLKQKKPNVKVKKSKDRGKESVWNEPDEPAKFDQNDIFRAGTLNRLVIRATTTTFNKSLMQTILLGHQSIFSSSEFWERLEDRYSAPKNAGAESDVRKLHDIISHTNQIRFIKMRVGRMVLEWMKEEVHAMESSVCAAIHHFATKTLQDDDFVDLKGMILKELAVEGYFAVAELKADPPLVIDMPVYGVCHEIYNLFFNYTHTDIAEQLTLIELKTYHQITRPQLIDVRWSKEKVQILSTDVHALLTRVNEVSYFTATIILLQKKYRDRVKIFSHLLHIAKCCLDIGNYNTFMGLLVGLRNGSVSRLPHTTKGLKTQTELLFQQLSAISDPTLNFKAVREHMTACKNVLVPYVGTFLSDITFTYEGNPDMVTPEGTTTEMINLTKFQMINRSIDDLLKYKNAKCDLVRKDPIYTFLKKLPYLEEKEMYAVSQLREPRGSNFKDIE